MHIRLHRVRLLKVIQECRHCGVPPVVHYRMDRQREEEDDEEDLSAFDDDDVEDSGSEDESADIGMPYIMELAVSGRESVASCLSLLGGEGKGRVGWKAAMSLTGTNRSNNEGSSRQKARK